MVRLQMQAHQIKREQCHSQLLPINWIVLTTIRLYLKNLPEKKINKTELKRALYMLFSTYGPVLDIVTRRMNMRGQAHVVYRDIQTATQAMRALQGFDFFGKEMVR
jgi:RNA recognition motif-containing protein